jgi:peroxiredoxin
MVSVVGAFLIDLALLDLPAIRNGWWSLLFFLVPLGFLILAWSPDRKGKLGAVATLVFGLGLVGYVSGRTVLGTISGTPALAVGEKAPDFELPDQDGRRVELSDFTKAGRVVLVFFRTSSCPNCRGQFREWMTRQADFKYSRVSVVAVGRVTPEEAKSMELPFTVLCDTDLAVARKYGLIHEKGYLFQDIARPATLILGTDRVVRWMAASDHVRLRPSVEQILEELRK